MDSLTMGELVELIKNNNLTLYQAKETLRVAIEKARQILKNQENGSFKKIGKIPDDKIARNVRVRREAFNNYLRPEHQIGDTKEERIKLLRYINATLKAGLNLELFKIVMKNFKQFSNAEVELKN